MDWCINNEKTEGPTQVIAFIGYEIDPKQGELRVPLKKCQKAIIRIRELLQLHDAQMLTYSTRGLLIHLKLAVHLSQYHIRSLITITAQLLTTG